MELARYPTGNTAAQGGGFFNPRDGVLVGAVAGRNVLDNIPEAIFQAT